MRRIFLYPLLSRHILLVVVLLVSYIIYLVGEVVLVARLVNHRRIFD